MALLDSIRDEFAEHNVPLHLVLGLISLARRMDPHLPSPPAAPAASEPSPPAPEAPGGDPLIHLLLGMISLRRTLLSELAPLRQAHAQARAETGAAGLDAPEPGRPATPRAGDLLR